MPGTVKPSEGELQVPGGCQCRWWTDGGMDRWLLHTGASAGLEGSPWPSRPGLRRLPCLGLCLAGSQAAEATRLGPRLPPLPSRNSRYSGSFLASDFSSRLLSPKMAPHPERGDGQEGSEKRVWGQIGGVEGTAWGGRAYAQVPISPPPPAPRRLCSLVGLPNLSGPRFLHLGNEVRIVPPLAGL